MDHKDLIMQAKINGVGKFNFRYTWISQGRVIWVNESDKTSSYFRFRQASQKG